MPYYRWKGIDLEGSMKKGVMHCSSAHDLEATLFSDDIALLWFNQKKAASALKPIRTALKVTFFRQLATLVDAGVYLNQAVAILYDQISHKAFKAVLKDANNDITRGLPLFSALQKYPDVFDSITIQLIRAGEQSGKIGKALALLADYHESRSEFRKQLRSAAFLPSITLLFFAVICIVIFVAIVPMFASMFTSLGKELPASTQRLEKISHWLSAHGIILLLGFSFLVFLLIKKFLKQSRLKPSFDYVVLKLPVIGSVLLESKITYFLQSTGLLLQGGVPIVHALTSSIENIENSYIKKKLVMINERVNKGESLSSVMKNESYFFKPDVIALIRVGEESGSLNIMIGKAAQVYRSRVKRTLHFCVTVFQPLLMIFLGLLIMALIVSVYVPIFDLSYAIH